MFLETVIPVDKPRKNQYNSGIKKKTLMDLVISKGKDVDFVNKKATDGVLLAHTDGGYQICL